MPRLPDYSARNPDLEALEEQLIKVEERRRVQLAADWARQEQALQALYVSNADLLASLQRRHRVTRWRILLEMLGLVLAVVGTLIAG